MKDLIVMCFMKAFKIFLQTIILQKPFNIYYIAQNEVKHFINSVNEQIWNLQMFCSNDLSQFINRDDVKSGPLG